MEALDSSCRPAGGELPSADYVYVPVYAVEASAGPGAAVGWEGIQDVLALGREWLRQELGITGGEHLAVLKMVGDSMEPTLQSGGLLLIDRSQDQPVNGAIHVVRLDGELMVKRLRRSPGVLHVVSDNPTGGSYDIRNDQAVNFAVIGRVVWAGRRF